MLRLYDFLESGNGYKVRLLLTQLGLPFERIELDITKGQTRTPEFLARNRPSGSSSSGMRPLGFLARKAGVRVWPLVMSSSMRSNGRPSCVSSSLTL